MVNFHDTAAHAAAEDPPLQQLLQLLRRQRWLILGLTALTLAAAAVFTRLQRPEFASAATLRIDEEQSALSLLSPMDRSVGPGGGVIETEVDVLRSRRVVEGAVEDLALHVRLHEPRVPRSAVFPVIRAGRDAAAGEWVLEPAGEGGYRLRGPGLSGPRPVTPGTPFRVGGVELTLAPAEAAKRRTIRFEVLRFDRAVAEAQEDLVVTRPNPRSQLVAIRYRSTDRQLAAAFPNRVAGSFIDYKQGTSRTESGSTVAFLREQVENYRVQLRESEQRLRAFRESANVVNLEEEATEQVRRLAELQTQREEVAQERDALQRLLASATAQGEGSPTAPSPYRQLASFPAFLSNRAIQDLLQSLTLQENRRAELLVMRPGENAEVRAINQRLAEMEEQLHQIAVNYLSNLNTRLATTEQALARFQGSSRTLPGREVEFVRLSRQARLLEEIYTLLEKRLKEAEIQNAVTPGDVQVIDEALVPARPVSPRPALNLAVAAVLGLSLSLGVALLRERMNTRITSRREAQVASGGLAILGTVPVFARAPVNGNGRTHRGVPGVGHRVVVLDDPQGAATEAFRSIRTSLTFANPERAPRVVVLTSALPGDGKSTSSANLAAAYAQQDRRVLLVDADLRRGVVHTVFGLPQSPGLTHVLLGMNALEEAVHAVRTTEGGSLDVLTTGVLPPNPAELIGSDAMRRFLDEARKAYDLVVFDAPPLGMVTDAALLGQVSDATLLVARIGNTDKSALHHAAAQLRQVRAPIAGLILNGVEPSAHGYYGAVYEAVPRR